jgi:hypothetical protein
VRRLVVVDETEFHGPWGRSARADRRPLRDCAVGSVLDQWPVLAAQLRKALLSNHETTLAASVDSLTVVALCPCGDDFCQSFSTSPRLGSPYGPGHRNVLLDPPWAGYLILDVVEDEIVFIEVLYRTPLD